MAKDRPDGMQAPAQPRGELTSSNAEIDAFLADPELPAALRRLVLEGRAGIERSLRARRFDGAGAA